MKKLIILIALILMAFSGVKAQIIEAKIKTSGQCEHCKETIEKNLRFEKGVKKVNFDIESHIVRVKFDQKKTTIQAIQIDITKLGYDADSLPADPIAYENLNACCKKQK